MQWKDEAQRKIQVHAKRSFGLKYVKFTLVLKVTIEDSDFLF
jgi:hypothetical protein